MSAQTVNILEKFEQVNRPGLITAAGFVSIGVVGLIDYLTGPDFSFSVFYVLPIAAITWVANRRLGLAAALASGLTWLAADMATKNYAFPLLPFWNSLIRLAFFVIITVLLASLKTSLELAHRDHLTTAINSRHFHELLRMELNRFQRHQRPFTVAYFDLDDFKAVNDQLGHNVGDQVLITLVDSIHKVIRKSDFIARLGGDEFAVLFLETDQAAARAIFEKVQSVFMEAIRENNWSITMSVGMLTCTAAPRTTNELIKIADELMYSAKEEGKNTVRYATYTG